MRFQDKDVADIRNRRKIADHPGKGDLRAATIINAKAQGMLDGSLHGLPRNSLRPIAVREELVDDVHVEAGGIGADQEFATTVLDDVTGCLGRRHRFILNCEIYDEEDDGNEPEH